MNVKRVGLGALILSLVALGSAQGQAPNIVAPDMTKPGMMDQPLPPPDLPSPATKGTFAAPTLSNWITYQRPGCCGPLGGDGPIQTETYVRSGASLPIEGAYFGHTLETGWVVQGGARVLLFDPPQENAWTVDLSVSNIYNHGQRSDLPSFFPVLNVPANTTNVLGQTNPPIPLFNFPVTVHALNRTFVNAAFGRELYLWGAANTDDVACRVGWDLGGRYGSANLQLNEIQHRTDVIGGVFFAVHTDAEIPWGKVLLTAGFRLEWDYTWSDILHEADVQDLNILITTGVRF
jgi:hypothetical protein